MEPRLEFNIPMSQPRIIEAVKQLHLPRGKFILMSGGALAARNIRPHGDIDLTVTPELFEKLRKQGWREGTIIVGGKLFFRVTRGNVEAHREFELDGKVYTVRDLQKSNKVENISGIQVIDLETLKRFKSGLGRDKDTTDEWLIEDYLSKNSLRR